MRKARTGRIRILGPGGIFLDLDEQEQNAVKVIEKKEEGRRKAKLQPSIPKRLGKMRVFREFDYTKRS